MFFSETAGQKVYFSEWVMLDEQKLLLQYRFPKPFKKKQSLSSNIKLQKLLKHTKFQIAWSNLDQTPSKFVPSFNTTLAPFGTKSIPVTGLSYKRAITATFAISHDGDFLPMQLIYQGTTVQSLPRFDFPNSVSLSMNPKHFSNTAEALKIIDEIIVPYLTKKRMGYTFLNITHLYL